MKKTLVSMYVIAAMSLSTASYANEVSVARSSTDTQTEEAIGLGSGILMGAVVGGPIGAFVGAVTGGLIGQSVGQEELISQQQQSLEEQTQTIAALHIKQRSVQQVTELYAKAQRQLKELQSQRQQQFNELAFGLNVQFKTGSAEVESHFQQQLDKVALIMSLSPALTLDLTGYADRRGDEDFNMVLSNQRVLEVKNYLINQGVATERLVDHAYGSSAPLTAEQNYENDFFDRRVTLSIVAPQSEVAATH